MPITGQLLPGVRQLLTVYEVANSLRFDDGSSTRLNRVISSGTTNTRFTISFWFKMCHNHTNDEWFFENYNSGSARTWVRFNLDTGNPRLEVSEYTGSYIFRKITNRVFRDVSAFYHIHIKFDSTQGTEADRLKIYVNGVLETSFAQINNPSLNATSIVANTGTHHIGYSENLNGAYFSGYMCEYIFLEGVAVEPDGNTGEFDEDSGIWKPIDVSGLTFGTNGFYLDFENSGSLGADVSGNGNNFTVNNLTSIDQSTDTCTNNFATLNPLANLTGSATFSEGNLKVAGDNSANHNWQTTFVVSSGKWYWELKDLTSSPDGSLLFYDQSISSGSHPGYGFVLNTRKKVIDGTPTGSAIGSSAQNDIWSMALDLDNGKMFIARNGTYLESGDPANGTNPFIQTSDGLPSEGVFGGHVYNGSMELNFGSPSFSISSGNSDGNGYGNFEYSVPSGYYALNTKNLAEYG